MNFELLEIFIRKMELKRQIASRANIFSDYRKVRTKKAVQNAVF